MLTPRAFGQSLRGITKFGSGSGGEGQEAGGGKGGGSDGESARSRERGGVDGRVLSPVSSGRDAQSSACTLVFNVGREGFERCEARKLWPTKVSGV